MRVFVLCALVISAKMGFISYNVITPCVWKACKNARCNQVYPSSGDVGRTKGDSSRDICAGWGLAVEMQKKLPAKTCGMSTRLVWGFGNAITRSHVAIPPT